MSVILCVLMHIWSQCEARIKTFVFKSLSWSEKLNINMITHRMKGRSHQPCER